MGDINAPALRAEDKGDRVVGASLAAGAVADAMRGFNELSLAVDQADDIAFRTGADAGATTQTFRRIEFRMK